MRSCLLIASLLATALMTGTLLTGCGGNSVSTYHPTGTAAKDALVVALDAWKSGREKAGTIEGRTPGVVVQDMVWDSGKKLTGYQIGQEQPGVDAPTKFSVELKFAGQEAPEVCEYFVYGIDPLWVLRDKDYQKLIGMGGQKTGG